MGLGKKLKKLTRKSLQISGTIVTVGGYQKGGKGWFKKVPGLSNATEFVATPSTERTVTAAVLASVATAGALGAFSGAAGAAAVGEAGVAATAAAGEAGAVAAGSTAAAAGGSSFLGTVGTTVAASTVSQAVVGGMSGGGVEEVQGPMEMYGPTAADIPAGSALDSSASWSVSDLLKSGGNALYSAARSQFNKATSPKSAAGNSSGIAGSETFSGTVRGSASSADETKTMLILGGSALALVLVLMLAGQRRG